MLGDGSLQLRDGPAHCAQIYWIMNLVYWDGFTDTVLVEFLGLPENLSSGVAFGKVTVLANGSSQNNSGSPLICL